MLNSIAAKPHYCDGKVKLSSLDRLEEREALCSLRDRVAAVLARVDLPDVLAEVAAWTGFTEEFTHVSEVSASVDNLRLSVCAVVGAEAANVGPGRLAISDVVALTEGRLSWVAQNYLRADTLVAANAGLVGDHATLPLAHTWGGGEVASADGLRFVVPVGDHQRRAQPPLLRGRPASPYTGLRWPQPRQQRRSCCSVTSDPTCSSITGMPKTKASVSLDPTKVAQARELLGVPTLSELIDIALDRLIVEELERRHAAGYLQLPPDHDDDVWAEAQRDSSGIADDVDWAGLYGVSRHQ